MTAPGPPPFVDPANPLLAGVPARLDTGQVTLPDGRRLGALTIRTASTTLTVFLSTEDLRTWAGLISQLASSSGGLVVPSAAESIILGKGNGRPPVA